MSLRLPLALLVGDAAGACILALLIGATPVSAQDEGAHTRMVLGAGVSFAGGGPTTDAGVGLAGHAGLTHQRGNLALGARAGMNGGGSAATTLPGGLRDRFDELAALVGYVVHRTAESQVVLSVGLAAVSGERVQVLPHGGMTNAPFPTRLGVPLQLALSRPGPRSGFGLVVHANLNPEEVFGAATATYLIGRRR